MKGPTNNLLTTGSGDWHVCQGTVVQVQLSGTFDGASVAIEIKDVDGNEIPLAESNTAVALTIPQARNVELPAGSEIRVTLSGEGLSTSIRAVIKEIYDARY